MINIDSGIIDCSDSLQLIEHDVWIDDSVCAIFKSSKCRYEKQFSASAFDIGNIIYTINNGNENQEKCAQKIIIAKGDIHKL